MRKLVVRKLREVTREMKDYLEMLESGETSFTEEYILMRIKECRDKKWVLEEILEEYDKEEYENE